MTLSNSGGPVTKLMKFTSQPENTLESELITNSINNLKITIKLLSRHLWYKFPFYKDQLYNQRWS